MSGTLGGRPAPRSACRSEEHTSELQSQSNLVCRLLLEKKKRTQHIRSGCHNPKIHEQPESTRHDLRQQTKRPARRYHPCPSYSAEHIPLARRNRGVTAS